MNEEILKRIDVLAEKLGTTATHIYQVYVAQARIEAIEDIIAALAFAAIALVCILLAMKNFRSKNVDQFVIAIMIIGAVISYFVAFYSILGAATEALNPEWWAIHHIAVELKPSVK